MQHLTFKTLVIKYVDNHFSLNKFTEATKENYGSFVKKLNQFLVKEDKQELTINYVNHELMENLYIFCRKKMSVTNSSRMVEFCKRSMAFAKKKGFIETNVISDIEAKRDKIKDVVYLEKNELQKLFEKDYEDKAIESVCDMYQFQALTGMSYGDLWSYRIIEDSACEWIFNKRNKNDNQYWVPLLPEAKKIHEKYSGRFPKIKQREYNNRIRAFAKMNEIEKYLTSHTARKTFATLMYEAGWSLESIADMMAISVSTLLKYYINKTRMRLKNEVINRMKKENPSEPVILRIVHRQEEV